MHVECVVPFTGDCPYRRAAWDWVRERLPYPARTGSCEVPWIKARAVMPAIEASDAEIVIVHDADVFCPSLPDAVRAVQEGAPWAVPHRGVHRLTEMASEVYMARGELEGLTMDEKVSLGMIGGGIVVGRREVLLDVPLDPRFVGWGQEDHAWGLALATLHGQPWRPTSYSPLVHLWHPPQERMTRRSGSPASKDLVNRYAQALDRPDRMRALLKEAECSRI